MEQPENYLIVKGRDAGEVEDKVRELIQNSWFTVGGVGFDGSNYLQAMIKLGVTSASEK